MPANLATETRIANLSLSMLGQAGIVDFNENSPAARVIRLHYEPARDALLRSHRWNFARKRATLSRLAAAPAFGWAYAYTLPEDNLRLLELNGVQASSADADFEIEGNELLTGAEEAKIVYVRRETDASKFDALFTEALAIKLAIAICLEITQSLSKKQELLGELEQLSLPEAVETDANESRSPIHQPGDSSPTISARGGGFRRASGGGNSVLLPTVQEVTEGIDGTDGWTPEFAVVSDGERRCLWLTGWTGGDGSAPDTGYVTTTGLTDTIALATDIRGAAGSAGSGDMLAATYDPNTVAGDAFDMDNMVEGTSLILTGAERAAIVANTAKTSNVTHTGEVTGGTALTLDATAVSGKALVTAVGADHVLIVDATDGALKKSLISDFSAAGGDMAAATYDPATIAEQLVGINASQTLTNKTFVGPILGTPASGVATNLTGTAAGLTAGAVSTITGLAPDTATTAAAQPNITSLGTLTALTVDDVTINGNTISSAGATTLAINPTAGQSITFDGTITLDAGVIAGATSITSTAFVGDLTGNADTVSTIPNLTGHITSTGVATLLGSFTVSQLSTALSDATLSGNNTGDQTAADIRALGFFDTSNDGTGSLLDADLLDGNHATDFATASQGTAADSALQSGSNISELTNDSGYITATLTNEQVQDIVGAMVTGNTETGITVAYQDIDGTIDFTVSAQEGTAILSTGEVGGSKFLREDGDGTCSWVAIPGGGDALVANPLSQFATTTASQLRTVLTGETTGTGDLVFATSPTLVTPVLGTPASGNLANCTFPTLNQNTTGNAATVTTNANLTGHITSTGNAAILGSFTLAQLNTALSDATAIDTGDSRLSDSRTCDNTFDSASTAKTNLSLNNVENTALSTWAGSTNLVTLGTGAVDAITEIASGLKTGSDTKLATGTAGTADYPAKWDSNGDVVEGKPLYIEAAFSDETTALTTGVKMKFMSPNYAITLVDISADVTTAPTTSSLVIDVDYDSPAYSTFATLMGTNKITIEATEFTSEDATTQPGLTVTAIPANTRFQIDVQSADSGGTSAGGVVKLYYTVD